MESSEGATRGSGSRRVAGMAAIALVAVVLLAVGFLFLSSFGISQVANNARDLHWTNATIGSAGIARASVAQAVFFSFDERLGVSSVEARDAAIEEAAANLDEVEALISSPDRPESSSLLGPATDLVAFGREVLDLAAAGRPDEAEATRLDYFEPAFSGLVSGLDERQGELVEAIAASQQTNGRIARITQLAITLIIPGSVMLAFWLILRRRVQRQEIRMTARLEAERELSKAKDDLVAGLSHELRTPLTTIVGFSNLLVEGGIDPKEAEEMLTMINAGSTDLSRMVEDLLVAARIDAGALSHSPMRVDLAEQARLVVAPYTRAGDSIDVRIPPIDIYADPLHVRQILHNLVSNARRHGGPRILMTANVEGTHSLLVVADDGPGVPQHVEEKLFQRFVNKGQKALVAGSVGLGLAIAQELAQGIGGSIRYKRVDGWTTFTVRFKVLPGPGDIPEREAENAGVLV